METQVKEKSKSFDFWKMCWDYQAIELNMLKEAVKYHDLKAEEYKEIVGEDYTEQ